MAQREPEVSEEFVERLTWDETMGVEIRLPDGSLLVGNSGPASSGAKRGSGPGRDKSATRNDRGSGST